MSQEREKHLLCGILAGAGAGLVASWVMNVFIAGPGQKLQESLATEEEKRRERGEEQSRQETASEEQDATMKTADKLTAVLTGGEHLTFEQQKRAAPVVHYGFGALAGGVYGAVAEYSCTARRGAGMAFGTALFAGADLVAVPAFHLSDPIAKTPAKSLATPFAAHLVYGVTTELLRRALRVAL